MNLPPSTSDSGVKYAGKVVSNILLEANAIGHTELEKLCLNALKLCDGIELPTVKAKKEEEKAGFFDFLIISPDVSPRQSRHLSIRFGIREKSTEPKNVLTTVFKPVNNIFNSVSDERDYEEITDPAILTAPIVDICIVHRGDPIPDGFYRLSKTPKGRKAELVYNAGNTSLFLCIKKGVSGENIIPVTGLMVCFPDRDEFVPPGYKAIRKNGVPCNINHGLSNERVFICMKKDNNGFAIHDIQPIFSKVEAPPHSFCAIEDSLSGQSISPHTHTVLCYRQELIGLKCLLNDDHAASEVNHHLASLSGNRISAVAESSSQATLESLASNSGDLEGEDIFIQTNDLDAFGYDEMKRREIDNVVTADGVLVPLVQRRLLHAMLVALSVRQGSVSEMTMHAFSVLLKDTNFFENDFRCVPADGFITMTDLTVEAVCERIQFSPETEFGAALQYLKILIHYGLPYISIQSTHNIMRSLIYICAYSSTRKSWLQLGYPKLDNGGDIEAVKVVKEFLGLVVGQPECLETVDWLPYDRFSSKASGIADCDSTQIVTETVWDLVNDIIETVEISRLTEATLSTLSKPAFILFLKQTNIWSQLEAIFHYLFREHAHQTCFVCLYLLARLTWGSIRVNDQNEPQNRDIGLKILAFDFLKDFCSAASEHVRTSKIYGFLVRRITVSCILQNVDYALTDVRVYEKILSLISVLWKSWRQHMLVDFGVLCEHFIVPILSSNEISPEFLLITVKEVSTWFEQPFHIVEMFVNFDMNHRSLSHWDVFAHLIRAISTMVRRLNMRVKTEFWKPETGKANNLKQAFREVSVVALTELAKIAKSIMDTTGHAYLTVANRKEFNSGESSFSRVAHMESDSVLIEANQIFLDTENLGKVVKFLVSKNFINDSPIEIANFLRVYGHNYGDDVVGEFLGEGGRTDKEKEFWNQMRYRYVRAVSFVEMELEPALRLFLTGCGFRLPGEAQKIERFVEVFATTYWQDNQGSVCCPLQDRDTVLILSYAIIMLNTDLHRANVDTKRKVKRMTKDEFVKNLRGCNGGKDLDREFLCKIFDTVLVLPIVVSVGADLTDKRGKDESNFFATLINTILSKAKFSSNSQAKESSSFSAEMSKYVRSGQELLRSLSSSTFPFHVTGIDIIIVRDLVLYLFDSVWANFLAISEGILTRLHEDSSITFAALDIVCYCLTSCIFLDMKAEKMQFANQYLRFKKICDMSFGTRGPILPLPVGFQKQNDKVKAPPSPSRLKVQNSFVKAANALEQFAISPIRFHMKREIRAENIDLKDISKDEDWYQLIELEISPENTIEVVQYIHRLISFQKDVIKNNTTVESLKKMAAKFDKRDEIMDGNIYFVREGDLTKLNRAGKETSYRFFLFSDMLVYAQVGFTGEYKVQEIFSLWDLTATDRETDPDKCSMNVKHPSKTFVIIAENPEVKNAWLADIRETAANSLYRRYRPKVRSGLLDRLTSQQKEMAALSESRLSRSKPVGHTVVSREFATSLSRAQSKDSKEKASEKSRPKSVDGTDLLKLQIPPEPLESVSVSTNQAVLDSQEDVRENFYELSSEERGIITVERRRVLKEITENMPEDQLTKFFINGLKFFQSLNERYGASVFGEAKVKLYALYKQAKSGPFIPESPSTLQVTSAPMSVTEAFFKNEDLYAGPKSKGDHRISASTQEKLNKEWEKCGAITRLDAMKEFLYLLFEYAPYWKYERFL